MSKYTTELRNIIIMKSGLSYDSPVDALITAAAPNIFPASWSYSGDNRLEWECDFLRHFYMREIGAETYGLWSLWLTDWLRVEYPYFDKQYEQLSSVKDWLGNINIQSTEQGTETTAHTGTDRTVSKLDSTTTETLNRTTKQSGSTVTTNIDTPQGSLSNFLAGKYMTSATKVEANSPTVTETGSPKTVVAGSPESTTTYGKSILRTPNLVKVQKGYYGQSAAKLYKEFVEAYQNITAQAFDSADKALFMQLW